LPTGKKDKITVIPLGGLGEIGKNMVAIGYQNDIVVVDCGLMFPEDDMLGVDFVIPDITYLLENREKVRGILLTHGHEDHIGGLSYVLKDLPVPIFATRLTMGLIKERLAEHGMAPKEGSQEIRPAESFRLGSFRVEPFRVNHSIPDAVGFALHTPVGTVVHTGDFKFDQTPVDGQVADFQHIAEIGRRGVLLLLSDSTNAERPGWTGSESQVGRVLDEVIAGAKGRVLVASFASNVHRIQQVVMAAHRHGRRIAFVGRSMENTVQVALGLGYLTIPEGVLIGVDEINRLPANQLVIMTTGSQGEPMAALSRMAAEEHKRVQIVPGDTVVIAATPVPGNEKSVARTIDNLYKRGAIVVYSSQAGVHVSGHASQEEQKLMLNLIRPKFFIPIHGEFRHLVHHANLAEKVGIPKHHILIGENGTVFEVGRDSAAITGKVTAGKVLVDGLGVGDVGNIVLRDRKVLAEDGVMVVVVGIHRESAALVAGPDIVSRGFVYVRENDKLIDEAKSRIRDTLRRCDDRTMGDWSSVKGVVRETLSKFLYEKTRRRPMILPIVVEV
jgi:ribonuclease J